MVLSPGNKNEKENENPVVLEEADLDEDMIMEGRHKIKAMYNKANDQSEVDV